MVFILCSSGKPTELSSSNVGLIFVTQEFRKSAIFGIEGLVPPDLSCKMFRVAGHLFCEGIASLSPRQAKCKLSRQVIVNQLYVQGVHEDLCQVAH